jgi:hypothetical protein
MACSWCLLRSLFVVAREKTNIRQMDLEKDCERREKDHNVPVYSRESCKLLSL